jgi:hypothetical protein
MKKNDYTITSSYDYGNVTKVSSYADLAHETIYALNDTHAALHPDTVLVKNKNDIWLSAMFKFAGGIDRVQLTYDDNPEFVATILQLDDHQWDLTTDGSFSWGNGSIKTGETITITHLYQ